METKLHAKFQMAQNPIFIQRPLTTSEAVEVNYFEVSMKWPPTALEVTEVKPIKPKTSAYKASFSFLGLTVWICITDKNGSTDNSRKMCQFSEKRGKKTD